MSEHLEDEAVENMEEPSRQEMLANTRIRLISGIVIAIVFAFLLGLGGGYLKWGQDETAELKEQQELARLSEEVNPKDGYTLPVSYGDLGPRLLASGVIGFDAFAAIYDKSGEPLSNAQIDILKKGSDQPIVITRENAHFLLNFLWAVGLANKNPILTKGPMVQYSNGPIENFASTGGWTLATKPVTELYASLDLIPLTAEQQALVEKVAGLIYRPCCNNPTLFPDCNHGMAMLGLLEMMASEGATADEMLQAAKYVNAYWFPQQTLETAIYLKTNKKIDFADAEPKLVVGKTLSSASGANMVHQALVAKGLLKQAPGQGGNCAN